jgi:hypothetical protein
MPMCLMNTRPYLGLLCQHPSVPPSRRCYRQEWTWRKSSWSTGLSSQTCRQALDTRGYKLLCNSKYQTLFLSFSCFGQLLR